MARRTIPPYETIFDNSDYQLKHFHNGPNVLVTFTPLYRRDADDRDGFGAGVFDQYGYSMLCVIGKWDHWWQPDGISDLIKLCRETIKKNGYASTCTYGISMGAYGAGLYADELGASRAIMIAPQFSIDPKKPPYEARWAREASRITFTRDDMSKAICGLAERIVIFDPWHSPDRVHADMFIDLGCSALKIPFSSHSPADNLKEAKILRQTIGELIDGKFNHADHRQKMRFARRTSPSYLAKMANKISRRWPTAALTLIDRAIEIDPNRITYHSMKLNIYINTGNYMEAIKYSTDSLNKFPQSYSMWKTRSLAASKLGDHAIALHAAKRAFEIRPNDVDLAINLINCLISSGDKDEAWCLIEIVKSSLSPLPKHINRLDEVSTNLTAN